MVHLATIASAFVDTFGELFVARAGVAIGEAALTPVAISLIADMFPWKKRAFPTSIYMAIGVLMGSGAFVVGAGAVELAEVIAGHFPLEIWHLTFVVVGMPGLALALVATGLI